eukprot:TRINITY_DN24713_c0_g1_i1.p1 TRINITY_DN24713_c0_g1~~TRINITY_DN24713_c0_g1_i1.p1  ORF type:complete len:563 (-),score=46.91 TRINITY_DN24713_c0_g1_i1:4-1692(-)
MSGDDVCRNDVTNDVVKSISSLEFAHEPTWSGAGVHERSARRTARPTARTMRTSERHGMPRPRSPTKPALPVPGLGARKGTHGKMGAPPLDRAEVRPRSRRAKANIRSESPISLAGTTSNQLAAQTEKCLLVHEQLKQSVLTRGDALGFTVPQTVKNDCAFGDDGFSTIPTPCESALIERREELRAEVAASASLADALRLELEEAQVFSSQFEDAVIAARDAELARLDGEAVDLRAQISEQLSVLKERRQLLQESRSQSPPPQTSSRSLTKASHQQLAQSHALRSASAPLGSQLRALSWHPSVVAQPHPPLGQAFRSPRSLIADKAQDPVQVRSRSADVHASVASSPYRNAPRTALARTCSSPRRSPSQQCHAVSLMLASPRSGMARSRCASEETERDRQHLLVANKAAAVVAAVAAMAATPPSPPAVLLASRPRSPPPQRASPVGAMALATGASGSRAAGVANAQRDNDACCSPRLAPGSNASPARYNSPGSRRVAQAFVATPSPKRGIGTSFASPRRMPISASPTTAPSSGPWSVPVQMMPSTPIRSPAACQVNAVRLRR